MTADQTAAFNRVRVRAWLMHGEASTLLLHNAMQTGDSRAVTLAAAVADALAACRDYAAGQGVGEDEEQAI